MDQIQIVLADDHKLVLDGLSLMIGSEPSFNIMFMAKNGLEASEFVIEHNVDLLLMDLNMPEMNGLQATKKIIEAKPKQNILILSMLSEIKLIRNIISAGAKGYLLKNSGQEELVLAMKEVLKGKNYYDQRVMEILINSPEKSKIKSNFLPSISRREKEILRLVIKEYTTKEIADKLFISFGTVESHRRNIISKLGVRNTAGLVAVTYEYGLLD